MAYCHNWEPEGVYMKFWGKTSGEEIDEAISHLRNHPDLSGMRYAVADYMSVDEFLVTRYQTLIIAAHDHWMKDANSNLKIALVGSRPDILEAFQAYANSSVIMDTFQVRVFQALEEAKNWVAG